MGGLEEADECLVKMGYTTGVRGAIRRFREHTAALQELALRWHPDPPELATPASESAEHPNGIFKIESDGPDKGRLMHVWPGWGRRFLMAGTPEDLRSQALRIVRQGGPFGGPTIARKGEHVVQLREPQGGMRHPLADGSEIRTLLLGDRMLGVRIWPDGRFAQLPISDSLDALAKLIEDDAEHMSIDSKRKPWIFTNVHPFLGMIRSGPTELLLCALRVDRVGFFISRGDKLIGVKVGPWDKIRERVRDEDFASPPPSGDGAARKETPAGGKSAAAPEKASAGEKSAAGAAAREAAANGETSAEPSAATDKDAGKDAPSRRRKHMAASPGAAPGQRERRVRLKAPLARAITHHLAGVASQLPARVLGAAFAVELLRALEAAALSDHQTLTGNMAELFSRLLRKGFLASIPADQAGRAALKLLAERTPLVRKIHYRRWSFAFGDVHDSNSALRARLGPITDE